MYNGASSNALLESNPENASDGIERYIGRKKALETIDQRYPELIAAEGQASVNKIKSDKTTVFNVGHLDIV